METVRLTPEQETKFLFFLESSRSGARALARRFGLPAEDGEDALHDLAVKLLENPCLIERYCSPQQQAAVRRKLINLALAQKRHGGNRTGENPKEEPASGQDLDSEVARRECMEIAFETCTAQERKILELLFVGFSLTDIGHQLLITPQAVRQAIHLRVLPRLRRELGLNMKGRTAKWQSETESNRAAQLSA